MAAITTAPTTDEIVQTTIEQRQPHSPLVKKPPLFKQPTELADDESSTLASTYTGTGGGGPVSYVEFSSQRDRGAAAASGGGCGGAALANEKTRPVMQEPDDSRLSSIPKLLVADLWTEDTTKLIAALDHMAALCNKPENITEMLSHGGHMSLILLLRKWSDCDEIQSAGLETLHQAAESLDFCNAVVQLGALELVVVAMKNHPTKPEVLTAACGALLNLTLPANNAKQLVCELQGIQTVAQACAAFPKNVQLQKYALWLIQYMSYWDDFKSPIVQAGGLQILTRIVENFSASTSAECNSTASSDSKSTDNILKSARATVQRLL